MQDHNVAAGHARSGPHPVLVPVDFSSCSRAALQFAARFLRCVRAPLVIVHVIHEQGDQPGYYRRGENRHGLRPVADIAREMLAEFVDEVCAACGNAAGSIQPRLLVVNGLPATRICEIAVREQAALIIMGTHARSGLARLTTGSVAAEVVRQSTVPVTIVKAAAAGTDEHRTAMVSSDWWFHTGTAADSPTAESDTRAQPATVSTLSHNDRTD